jgi:hypothetical protein
MEFQVNVWATVKILTTSSYNLIRNCQTCSFFMESAGAMYVKMQKNMQYVFQDVCHNVFLRLVVPRKKLERKRHWTPILFTNEPRFRLTRCDGRVRVYRRPGERYTAATAVQEVDRFGRGCVIVWAGISIDNRTDLVVVPGRLCHPWFFAQHTPSGIVGCLQNSLFCWREDKRARDSFENIPSYQENLHSRFFLF